MRFRRGAIGLLAAVSVMAACSRKPASIEILPKKVQIYGLERSQRLSARVLDKKGEPVDLSTPTWSSSNQAVVETEAGGRLIAKKAGKTMVTATYGGITAQVPVEVIDVSMIEIAPPNLAITGPAGTSIPLTFTVKDSKQAPVAMKPAWSTTDPKIATISPDGVVTSVAAGTTMVVAKIGDIQGGCDVSVVLRPIARIEIHPATALGRVGESQHFLVTAYGPDGVAIPEVNAVFTSSNPDVAAIDSAGMASCHKAGAATIRAELAGQRAEATLLVN
jgi:hypothetical protein